MFDGVVTASVLVMGNWGTGEEEKKKANDYSDKKRGKDDG